MTENFEDTDVPSSPMFKTFVEKKYSDRAISLRLTFDVRDDPAGFGSIMKSANDAKRSGSPWSYRELSSEVWKMILAQTKTSLSDVFKCETLDQLNEVKASHQMSENVYRLHCRYWIGRALRPTAKDGHTDVEAFSSAVTNSNTALKGTKWWEAPEPVSFWLIGKTVATKVNRLVKILQDEKKLAGATPAQLESLTVEHLFGFTGSTTPTLTAKEERKTASAVLSEIGFDLGF